MLCICMGYSREEFEKMIMTSQYQTISDFQNDTFVGMGCGRCVQEVESIFKASGRK